MFGRLLADESAVDERDSALATGSRRSPFEAFWRMGEAACLKKLKPSVLS
jgi:hypothetical protein